MLKQFRDFPAHRPYPLPHGRGSVTAVLILRELQSRDREGAGGRGRTSRNRLSTPRQETPLVRRKRLIALPLGPDALEDRAHHRALELSLNVRHHRFYPV